MLRKNALIAGPAIWTAENSSKIKKSITAKTSTAVHGTFNKRSNAMTKKKPRGELIQLAPDKRPKVVCLHCKQQILMDITPFKDDASKIFKDNCPRCGGMLYTGILILSHKDMRQLLLAIQRVVEALNTGNLVLGSE